jgi:acyl-CoA thioesterase-1
MNRMVLRCRFHRSLPWPGCSSPSGRRRPPCPRRPPPRRRRPRLPAVTPKPPEVSAWQKARDAQMKDDFPWLAKFKEADLALGPPAAGEDRVVFMGDSITEGWKIEGPEGSFPGKPYINRGISGQTTPQMLVRFRQDVIALKPKVVVILAGINDIAGNTGPG